MRSRSRSSWRFSNESRSCPRMRSTVAASSPSSSWNRGRSSESKLPCSIRAATVAHRRRRAAMRSAIRSPTAAPAATAIRAAARTSSSRTMPSSATRSGLERDRNEPGTNVTPQRQRDHDHATPFDRVHEASAGERLAESFVRKRDTLPGGGPGSRRREGPSLPVEDEQRHAAPLRLLSGAPTQLGRGRRACDLCRRGDRVPGRELPGPASEGILCAAREDLSHRERRQGRDRGKRERQPPAHAHTTASHTGKCARESTDPHLTGLP